MEADFTPAEMAAALREFCDEIGPNADSYASINTSRYYSKPGLPCSLSLYPNGITGNGETVSCNAATWREALSDVKDIWAERSDQRALNTIRSMALRIISITTDQGECSDAALRAEFEARDVIRYGERACAEANEMAGRGPFSIVTLRGANEEEAA